MIARQLRLLPEQLRVFVSMSCSHGVCPCVPGRDQFYNTTFPLGCPCHYPRDYGHLPGLDGSDCDDQSDCCLVLDPTHQRGRRRLPKSTSDCEAASVTIDESAVLIPPKFGEPIEMNAVFSSPGLKSMHSRVCEGFSA